MQPEAKPLPPLGRTVARPDARDWSLGTHRTVSLVSQNLVLSLPQGHVWQSLPRRGTWSGLWHEATESELWVRHVPARRTVSLGECEKEARLSWPLLRTPRQSDVVGGALLDSEFEDSDSEDSAFENSDSEDNEFGSNQVKRSLHAPEGYGGRLSVILLPQGGGRIEAFAVGVSRCLAVVFTTTGAPGFPERLRVMTSEVIETMRVPNVGERSRPVRLTPY